MSLKTYRTIQEINFTVYTYLGFWKVESKNRAINVSYFFFGIISMFLTTCHTGLQVIDLIVSSTSLEDVAKNLSATGSCVMSVSKVYIFRYKMKRVEELRRRFRDFLDVSGISEEEENRVMMEEKSVEFLKLCKLLYVLTSGTVLGWWIIPIFSGNVPLRMWLPFEFEPFSRVFFAVYSVQAILMIPIGATIVTMDLTLFSFVTILTMHIAVLEKNLRRLGESAKDYGTNPTGFHRKFAELIRHHQQILRASREVEETFRATNLIHLLGGFILISVGEFYIAQKTTTTDTLFYTQFGNIITIFVDLYMYCFFGNELEEKSKSIADMVYDLPWYEMPLGFRKISAFMIARGQKRAVITAGKMININLVTFLVILKNSYNVFALLRQTTHK